LYDELCLFYRLYYIFYHAYVAFATGFTYLAVKVGLNSKSENENDFNSFTQNVEQFTVGLKENIKLPETSE